MVTLACNPDTQETRILSLLSAGAILQNLFQEYKKRNRKRKEKLS